MKLEAPEASSTARPRISAGSPIRPRGTVAPHCASAATGIGPSPPIFVRNGPGAGLPTQVANFVE